MPNRHGKQAAENAVAHRNGEMRIITAYQPEVTMRQRITTICMGGSGASGGGCGGRDDREAGNLETWKPFFSNGAVIR
jgi:hypothetical protein